jgi:beta-phosphoglucomutase family hydrolase
VVEPVTISRRDFDAAIFDLDGVLTDTTSIHAEAWKTAFDAFLQRWEQEYGVAFKPFDINADYFTYVNGRPRHDGIRAFLAARDIHLPDGSEHDYEDANTVRALGAQKTRLFLNALKEGVDPAIGAEALLKRLRTARIGTAVGSSSKNASAILHAAGLNRLIDVRVDGMDAEALGLPGKPDPALFLEAAQRLGARPARTILFEDALAGVEAGDRGGFGRVVGIDRGRQMGALLRHGADAIIRSLREVKVEES